MKSVFYHYTSAQKFRSVESGDSYGKTGLIPLRRFLRLGLPRRYGLPEEASEGAVYGLLHPLDRAWCIKTFHPGAPLLETVLGDVSTDRDREIYLLQATVVPTDDAYIANYAPHLTPEYLGRDSGDEKIVKKVKRAYWNSLVPFKDYIKGGVSYLVPEVLCFSPIPLGRLRVLQIHHQDSLINRVRAIGGFPLHPPPPEPDWAALDALFGGESEPGPGRPVSSTADPRDHLHLV